MAYTILKEESVPEILKNKPRWVSFVAFLLALILLVALAISVGIFLGYTYCYFEYHTGLRKVSAEPNFRLTRHMPKESAEAKRNRTINGAIASSLLVSRILTMGHTLIEEELSYLPWANKAEGEFRAR